MCSVFFISKSPTVGLFSNFSCKVALRIPVAKFQWQASNISVVVAKFSGQPLKTETTDHKISESDEVQKNQIKGKKLIVTRNTKNPILSRF